MRIVALYESTPEILGLGVAFTKLGHEYFNWFPSKKCAFDMAEELRPEALVVPSESRITDELEDLALKYGILLVNAQDYSGVDTLRFAGKKNVKYECNVGFYSLGGLNEDYHEIALKLFQDGLKVKIWGTPVIHSPFYLGQPNYDELGDLIATVPILISKQFMDNSFLYNNLGSNELSYEDVKNLLSFSTKEKEDLTQIHLAWIEDNNYEKKALEIIKCASK